MMNGLGGGLGGGLAASGLNGSLEGLDGQEPQLPKSAFMDLQQPQQHGMAAMHPAYSSSLRTSYPSQHHTQHHDALYSTAAQHGRGGLGYPFPMGPGGYGGAPTHFSMGAYGTTPSPPLRDGK